jgi:hypothetical protein
MPPPRTNPRSSADVETDEEPPRRRPAPDPAAGQYSTQRSALETKVNAALEQLEALNKPGGASPAEPAAPSPVAPLPTSGKRLSLSALKAEEAKVFRASKKNFIGDKVSKKPR